jgi:hypothetical protein
MQTKSEISAVSGMVRGVLRMEGLAVLAVATVLYFLSGGVWWLFALLLFAPDLSFFGYLGGNKIGAVIYNIAHSYILPLLLVLASIVMTIDLIQHIALIYFAHIGLDRSLGYGLKYAKGFKHTHLGVLNPGHR